MIKRLPIITLIISILCYQSLFAQVTETSSSNTSQGQVSGKVIDAQSGNPVDFASVVLLNAVDSQTVKGAQTDLEGSFKIVNVAEGTYIIKVSFVGYQPFTSRVLRINSTNQQINLNTISLSVNKANVLQEVVVQAQPNAIRLGIDRKVFSVDQNLVSQGGNATDLLANIPTLSVDIDGNVSLRGSSGVRILIDGKPSAIGGGDMAQVLQSLPANSIETIELVTNPSSKYDAEGQSGIINIVLKKNKKVGLNGNLTASTGSYDNYNAGTSLSYRDGNVNIYGNYNYRSGNRLGGGFNNTRFLSSNGIVENMSDSERFSSSHSFKVGTDFFLNPKTTLGVSGNFSFRDNSGNDLLSYSYLNLPSQNGTSRRSSDESEGDKGYDLSLDFNRDFKRKGENLMANFSYGEDKEDQTENFNQLFYFPTGGLRDSIDRRTNNNGEFTRNLNFQVDYTLPFNADQKLETGFRSSIRKDEESQVSDYFDRDAGGFVRDYDLTNDFDLEDIVHALYANYQQQLNKTFGFQFGLRAEQAYLNTVYRGLDPVTLAPTSTSGKLDYFRIYPSMYLTSKLSESQQLQLSYTRRVNRPRGWQVNPFRDISDPNNIQAGNPNLRPEDIHSFELSYINYWKALTLTSSVYYRQVNDVVERIRRRIDENSSATITEFYNLTNSRATGLELIAKADIVKNFSLTANTNLYFNRFKGNEEFDIRDARGFNWNASLTGNLTLPANITAQFNGFYMAPRVSAQGRSREMYSLDAGLRKDFLKNRAASLALNVRDIFNSRQWSQYTQTAEFIQDSQRRMQGRLFNLTLSYRFGKQDMQRNRQRNNDTPRPPSEEEF